MSSGVVKRTAVRKLCFDNKERFGYKKNKTEKSPLMKERKHYGAGIVANSRSKRVSVQ